IPDPRSIFRLAGFIKKWKPLILHSHMVHANLLGRIVRIFATVPVVISTAHNINEGARWREIAYRVTDFLTDITTNVSQAAVDRYIDVGAAPRDRIRFIPNGLNTDEFTKDEQARQLLRDELGVKDAFLWLAVGRLVEAKDYPNMFRAFASINYNINTRLFIVGQGELEQDLKQQVRALGLEKRIQFLGVRQDIPQLMNAADGYVMSSAWEGLPMVLLEAAATGMPIVATDVGGNREVVLNGTSGFVVTPYDSEQLANAMQDIMTMSENERATMGKVGRQYVVDNYSLDNVVSMWEDLYWELLRRKGVGN
ncbi:MAG: glycosyltransferase, partial [Gammaproteobacteria bacterium]|nr:glycosyltransferase [Gammaproteobacteria bacterium]